jgi:hypothetical protein
MPIDPRAPNLVMRLPLDRYAPRAARFQVATVDSPSPDLRNSVVLLTSEIVTRAVERLGHAVQAEGELRVWMPPDLVRVELRAPAELLRVREGLDERHYGLMLLDCIADRWAIELSDGSACQWFEIDRQPLREERSPDGLREVAGIR